MNGDRQARMDELKRYERLIERQSGHAVRPFRADGYVNMMNKYGTKKDISENYRFVQEPVVPDEVLTMYYEGNGLFAKIIDTPAEEAIKNGFVLDGINDSSIEEFYTGALEELDWDETVITAIKWCRLFGGSLAVMLIDDGRGLDEPLDWKNIHSIDDIRVYDRSIIQPDYNSMYGYSPEDPFRTRGSRLGSPEYYNVFSRYGNFRVHDSRCLVFRNGTLPENTTNSIYQLWGMPEYVRVNKAIRDAEVAHSTAPKLLDRSVQAVYKMKDLAAELATEGGEDRVLKRLQTIDMARGLLNSITIDSEGEDYDFRTFQFSGVSDVIDSTCNFLSAITSIPQTILFGRSPSGMNSTGTSDLENWYNYLQRIQNRMIKKNLRYLLSVIFQAGVYTGEVDEVPEINVKFNPLWSLSEAEQATLEQQRAQVQQTRAQTAQIYVDMQAIDPSEVRKKLADSEDFDVETMLDEYDEEDLFPDIDDEESFSESEDLQVTTEEPLTDSEPGEKPSAEESGDINTDGGTGSGNYGHEGRPGNVGGSLASASTYNKSIADAYKTGNYSDVGKAVRSALKSAPIGASFNTNGTTWTKTGDNEYTNYSKQYGNGDYQTNTENAIVNSIDAFDKENALTFNDIKSTDVAEEKVKNGEIAPDETSVNTSGFVNESEAVGEVTDPETGEILFVPSYKGQTEFENGYVSQDAMNSKKVEFTQYNLDNGIYEVCGDEDVERMVESVKAYGLGGQCQEILSAQSPEQYTEIRSMMSDEKKEWAKTQADNLEEFIEKSGKVEQTVYRGVSLNDAYQDGVSEYISSLKTGNTLEMGHIASWSTSKGTAKSYSMGAVDSELEEGTNYSVTFSLSNPKSVASLKGINPEGECLSSSKSKYKISDVKETYDEELDLYEYDVALEEI